MKLRAIRVGVLTAIYGSTFGLSQTVIAQQAEEQEEAASPLLEEILVTATRQTATVQNLPMAVTAISSESMEIQNIENLVDVTGVVPNVLIFGGGRGIARGNINMRGIPRVGMYIDGIWQVSSNAVEQDAGLLQRQFVEIDRVEVLRGPQGTIVGRDSTGGSIQIFTKPPQEEFGMSVNMGIGDFNRRDASASVDIPITENLLSKWTVASYQKDGFVTSVVTGESSGDLANDTVRGDLLWTPTDRARFRLIYEEGDQVGTTARVQTFINPEVAYDFGWQVGIAEAHDIASLASGGVGFNCQSTVAGCPGGQIGEYESRQGSTNKDSLEREQTTLNFDYDISEDVSFKYVFGNTKLESTIWTDFAGAEYNFFTNLDLNRIELDSHEIQFSGNHERVSWFAGAYTWDQANTFRGLEWSHSDWTHAFNSGAQQVLDYADVLASPTCQMTAQDRGRNFDGRARADGTIVGPADGDNGLGAIEDSWPLPCSRGHVLVPFGLYIPGIVSVFNSTNGFDGSDRSELATQDGTAYFASLTFDITDRWDVTAGYRSHDQTNQNWDRNLAAGKASGLTELRPVRLHTTFASFDRALNAPIIPGTLAENSFDKSTIRLATSYDINDDTMIYAQYAEGFNAGGIAVWFDSAGRHEDLFQPETIENIELGLRADFLDGRLRTNLTYYDTDWVDIQATLSLTDTITGQPITEITTKNIGDGSADGFEAEITYAATDHLLLVASLGTSDTKYVDLNSDAQVTENTEFGGAPDKTHSLSIQYNWDLPEGARIMARFQGNYWGKYWRSPIPSFREDAYGGNTRSGDFWTTSARLVYTPAEGNYEISLWGNNLNDAYNINSGFMDSIWQFDFAGVDAPREIGLSMKMTF